MRVITKGTLRKYWHSHKETEQPLKAWYHEAKKADWKTPNDIKDKYRTGDQLKGSRFVFNIGGNKHRLIVKINCPRKTVYIRFIGTHSEYDKIDAKKI